MGMPINSNQEATSAITNTFLWSPTRRMLYSCPISAGAETGALALLAVAFVMDTSWDVAGLGGASASATHRAVMVSLEGMECSIPRHHSMMFLIRWIDDFLETVPQSIMRFSRSGDVCSLLSTSSPVLAPIGG